MSEWAAADPPILRKKLQEKVISFIFMLYFSVDLFVL